jgi:hypothetical protein
MDYRTLMQTIEAMNDEELLLAEKKINQERRRRYARAPETAIAQGNTLAQIDLEPLVNGVRQSLRIEMSSWPEATLVSVIEQIRDFPQQYGDEAQMMQRLIVGLGAVYIHEARCEMARRMPV